MGRTTEDKRMREGKQHEHTKKTEEGQAVTGQGQHEGSTPRGEPEEKRGKRKTRRRREEYCMTGDRLAAAANEHLKKDNKKAIE